MPQNQKVLRNQSSPSSTQGIEQDANHLLANIEIALTAVAPFIASTENFSDTISDEFVRLCLQIRGAPRSELHIALEQMQAVLETLPVPVLIQSSSCLTLRTLLQVALEGEQGTPRLRCNALGFLCLELHGENGMEKRTSEVQGELLTFFLMQPRRPWSDEQIFEALWSEKDFQRAQWSFHTARKRLHEFFGEEVLIKLKRGQYGLNPDLAIHYDVAEFESLLSRAQTLSSSVARMRFLEHAVQLYRGDFLEKNYKDWVVPIRSRLREKYIAALLQLGELTKTDAPQQAIGWYEKVLHTDDLNEDVYLKLMGLYVQTNNTFAAHRTFILCIDTFHREMGTGPSVAFTESARSLLGDNNLKFDLGKLNSC